MKRIGIFAVCFIMLCFYGCETDTRSDIISFCESYNELTPELKIMDSSLLRQDGGDYMIFVGTKDKQTLMRIGCDDSNAVRRCIITGRDKETVMLISKSCMTVMGTNMPNDFFKKLKAQSNGEESLSCRDNDFVYEYYSDETETTVLFERLTL